MSDAGLRLKREKCCFMKAEVIYLGHKIDAEGLHPTDQKISDTINAPEPRNVSELKAYLGMINYYSKYIGNISTKLAPLYLATRHGSVRQGCRIRKYGRVPYLLSRLHCLLCTKGRPSSLIDTGRVLSYYLSDNRNNGFHCAWPLHQ